MSVVIEAADLFAGSGGTWTGLMQAVAALGGTVNGVAVNHWPVAVATHSANHPEIAHYCMDLSTAEPEEMVPGRRLDLLVASPECVHFSRARGGKPVNEQRRSGADWVLRWLERLDVRVLLVENVKEFMSWGDLDDKGRPVSKLEGRLFVAWVGRLKKLGYRVEWKILNAADYGDVTTRERFFLIARKDGRPIRWPEPTHSRTGSADMFGHLKKWRAAREIIDWRDLGESMLDRPSRGQKVLSLKTRLRIARGLQRFGGLLAPLYIRLLDLPAEDETRFIAGCTGAVAEAFVVANTENAVPKSTDEPFGTFTTIPGVYLAAPTAEPFLAAYQQNAVPKSTGEPLVTLLTEDHVSLITPTAEPFTFANRNNATPHDPDGPIPGLTTATGGGVYVVNPAAEPFVLGQQSESAPRPLTVPIPTISTGGVIRAFSPTAEPFVDVYYQTGVADSVDQPLSTATTRARHALVSPFAVPYYGERPGQSERVLDLDAPLDTVTTAGRFGLVSAFLSPKFGERPTQEGRAHDLAEPLPTVTGDGAGRLVTATVELPAELASIDPRRLVLIDGVLHLLDIKFRMLKPSELAAAMGFPPDYVFTGTKTDIVKQIGNAVCVNTAAALIGAILMPDLATATEAAS